MGKMNYSNYKNDRKEDETYRNFLNQLNQALDKLDKVDLDKTMQADLIRIKKHLKKIVPSVYGDTVSRIKKSIDRIEKHKSLNFSGTGEDIKRSNKMEASFKKVVDKLPSLKTKKKLPTAEQFVASQKKEKDSTQIVPIAPCTKENGNVQKISKITGKIYGILRC